MRYQTYRNNELVAETDHADLAITGASSVNAPLRVLDAWTGEDLSFAVPAPRPIATTDDNPHGLPMHFIRGELTRLRTDGQASGKIPMIKLVRELTGIGLAQAKAIIDQVDADVRAEVMRRRDNY